MEAKHWNQPLDDAYWNMILTDMERSKSANEGLIKENSSATKGFKAALPSKSESSASSPNYNSPSNQKPEHWELAKSTFGEKRIVQLPVIGANRGGLLVCFHSIQGFVPASQLAELPRNIESDARQNELDQRIGQNLNLIIIELNKERNRLILSERVAKEQEPGYDRLDELKEGVILHGSVASICGFGAFVDLGGVEGLIHISELSWGRVNHPRDILQPGQEVDVYVLGVEKQQHRAALSLKRMKNDPWKDVAHRYTIGQLVEGEITNVVSFGAFARIEDGLEGLIHISELAEGNFLHPRNVIAEGDRVSVKILHIDSANHRLGLSLRQAHQRNGNNGNGKE